MENVVLNSHFFWLFCTESDNPLMGGTTFSKWPLWIVFYTHLHDQEELSFLSSSFVAMSCELKRTVYPPLRLGTDASSRQQQAAVHHLQLQQHTLCCVAPWQSKEFKSKRTGTERGVGQKTGADSSANTTRRSGTMKRCWDAHRLILFVQESFQESKWALWRWWSQEITGNNMTYLIYSFWCQVAP